MARKSFVQARPFAILGIILLVWLVLPPVFKSWTRLSFFEMQAPFINGVSYLRDIQNYWSLRTQSKNELIAGVRDLARLNAAYELRIQENEQLRHEIDRLEQLFDLPSFDTHRYEIARVARREVNGWWQQIVIRKGSESGIHAGYPVVFAGGVVGRVREVYSTTAIVDLLSNPQLRLAAVVDGDERPLSYQGGINPPLRPARGIVEYVPPDIRVTAGEPRRVVTSGLGGVFPPGIRIGNIVSLEPGPDGLFQSGQVELDTRLNKLTEVAVLIPLENETP